jgi:hypothetical protein
MDGTDNDNAQQTIQEHVLFEENSYIDESADAHNQLNNQLPNRDGRNNSIIPKFVVKLMLQYSSRPDKLIGNWYVFDLKI